MSRFILLLTALALLVGCGSTAPPEPAALQKITISFPTRSAASWPLFVAKEGGYYEKYGLDVTLTFGVHPTGVAMVNSGEAAMTNYSLESAMQASARDGSLAIYGSPLNKAVFSLVAQPSIPNVQALRGKRIAIGQLGDPPSNYATALISKYGLGPRDVEWIPIGSDANGRAAALQSGRVEATMITAPTYFKLEELGYRSVANLADHDDIFAATTYLMRKKTVEENPMLPELLIKAHAEAIKRFYDDQAFAVQAYRVYDPQTEQDVQRFYGIHSGSNLFERVPYVLAGAIESVIAQQSDEQMIALMKGFDFHRVVDNSVVERLVNEGFFEQLFGESIKAEQERKAALAFR
jgi:ABC-type nitrate/sulfonate/bicarbonate transport system substrate-binding protein